MNKKKIRVLVISVLVVLIMVFAYQRITKVLDAGELTPAEFDQKHK